RLCRSGRRGPAALGRPRCEQPGQPPGGGRGGHRQLDRQFGVLGPSRQYGEQRAAFRAEADEPEADEGPRTAHTHDLRLEAEPVLLSPGTEMPVHAVAVYEDLAV